MMTRKRGLTLVEVAVVLAAATLITAAGAGYSARMAEEARTVKCQSNLKRQITAILEYTTDYDGILPGPTHPAIRRHMYDNPGITATVNDRRKTLVWLLRPYLPPAGLADTDPALPDPVADEVFRCPTAEMISPDNVFFDIAAEQTSCWRDRPFNYVCNSWGPINAPGSTFTTADIEWSSTDPPHYFGAWYLCDSTPVRPDLCWRPKPLDSIANQSGEWATADAWFRRISAGGVRPGDARRQYVGTYAPQAGYRAPIPSAPYHRTNPTMARSHRDAATDFLPQVDFDGETNQAYFDGHAAAFHGSWLSFGNGGTANPYWYTYGGGHTLSHPWNPPTSCLPQPPQRSAEE